MPEPLANPATLQDAPAGSERQNTPEGYPATAADRGLVGRWTCRQRLPGTNDLPLLVRVLQARGLTDPAAATAFMQPSLRMLHDPSLMPDMDRAAQRLLDAARDRQPIVIYGDYDVDGISASAILFHMLRHLVPGALVSTYVPHRIDEGYGLNADAIRTLASPEGGGAKVIVSVDCGVTAIEPARVARECGVDLIITDHHNPPATLADLPQAFAVVHPRRPDSTYPFGDLSGSAVAYKLAWRLATLACSSDKVPPATRELLLELLGLASLGVIADVVPLQGENRVIARFGLSKLKHSSIVGLRALVQASGLAGESVGAYDVGFKLGPRLNACGRLGHAREAVELLTVADADRSDAIAAQLTTLNNERRAVEKRISDQAAEEAVAQGMTGPARRAVILAHDEWHAGVVGIACSRLVGLYHRPTILMHRDVATGECHGSGRSIDGFNLHGALDRCKHLLLGFGGHDMAAGVRVHQDNLAAFAKAFTDVANSLLHPDDLVASITYDTDAELDELTAQAVRDLESLAPFGRENPPVRLRLRGLRVEGRPKVIGKTGEHSSLFVKAASSARGSVQFPRSLRLIGWGWAQRLASLPVAATVDVVIEPALSTWNGSTTVEAQLIDLKLI